MLVKVCELVGDFAVSIEQGEAVYAQIQPLLLDDEAIELDFEGVRVFSSPFFNTAIGQLLRDISPEKLNRLLHIRHITPAGGETLKRVIENAKAYYSDENIRAVVDAVLMEIEQEG